MDTRFLVHNSHLENAARFEELDPQLRRLSVLPYQFYSSLLNKLPKTIPGIYTITGGRQIGKTTLLKQWMQKLLKENIDPQRIRFFSGELIDDYHALLNLLQAALESMSNLRGLCFIIIDEITYIRDWDKAVKYAADAGWLDNVILILTGSDLALIKEARVRFPGRRGVAKEVNFHYYSLSFREVMQLKHPKISEPDTDILNTEWEQYLLHGGYLTAINDIAQYGRVLESTLSTYSDWIRGDMLKRGKQEQYLQEILGAIIKRYGSQLSWNNLASDLSIDHPKTVADYVELLESMDALYVQAALLEDKLVAAPKKAKKILFCDPFIFHAIRAWIFPCQSPFEEQMLTAISDPETCAKLVESATVALYRRYFPTYYIKAEGEVDIAYIKDKQFFPVEIKWTNQLRPKDLKQIMKYHNSLLLVKTKTAETFHHIPVKELPLAMWSLE